MPNSITHGPSHTYEDLLRDVHSPIVYCTLQLDGENFLDTAHFTLDLVQNAGDHDHFSITVLDDAIDSFEGEIMENSKQLLGKQITVNLHNFGAVRYSFQGFITSIKNKKESGYGNLVIGGHAPTILLENGEDCKSFEKNSLSQIVQKASEAAKANLQVYADDVHLNVMNRGLILPYVVQYKESDFQFLKRMAARYGEWLFYDGSKLVFGAKPYEIIELQENVDLIEVEFLLQTKAQKFKYSAYDRHQASDREKSSGSIGGRTPANHLQVRALNASNELYQKEPQYFYNQEADELGKMLDVAMWRKNESYKNVMMVKGSSRNPNLAAGRDIKLIDINDHPMETYRISNIRHFHDGAGEYYNEFVAVPFDTWVPPYFNENAIPLCEEQSAQVVDNNDPEGMGRIRVQFTWQKSSGEKSPWLRIVTPYAGQGKGMYLIPEMGEEVIVGFENANAEKPFVIGAMYNGKGKSGVGGAGNFIKSIQTVAGQQLQMNDEDGSLHLQDNGGCTLDFDGSGNTNFKTDTKYDATIGTDSTTTIGNNNDVTIGSSNTIKVQNNNEINVGGGSSLFTMDSGGNIELSGSSQVTLKVGSSKITISGDSINIESGNITVDGKSITTVKGSGGSQALFQDQTIITGAKVRIN